MFQIYFLHAFFNHAFKLCFIRFRNLSYPRIKHVYRKRMEQIKIFFFNIVIFDFRMDIAVNIIKRFNQIKYDFFIKSFVSCRRCVYSKEISSSACKRYTGSKLKGGIPVSNSSERSSNV